MERCVMENNKKNTQVLPAYVTTIVMVLVCVPYVMALGTEFLWWHIDGPFKAESAREAYMGASYSFWNMVKVALVSFGIIVGSTVLSENTAWEKLLNKILCIFHMLLLLLFADYAYLNLYGEYISLYGPTPNRIHGMWVIYGVVALSLITIVIFITKIIVKFFKPKNRTEDLKNGFHE